MEDDLIIELQNILKEYLDIRNNKIKNLVYDLNKVCRNRFLMNVQLQSYVEKYSEVKKLMQYSLEKAQESIREEDRKMESLIIKNPRHERYIRETLGKIAYVDINSTMDDLCSEIDKYLDTRVIIRELVIRLSKMTDNSYLEDTRLKGLLSNYSELEQLVKYWSNIN